VAALQHFERGGPVGGFEHFEALAIPDFAKQLADLGVIVYEKQQRPRLSDGVSAHNVGEGSVDNLSIGNLSIGSMRSASRILFQRLRIFRSMAVYFIVVLRSAQAVTEIAYGAGPPV
jgi:hypothetical protein